MISLARSRRFFGLVAVVCGAGGTPGHASEETFDRLEQALTASAFDGQMRARLSGFLDLEGYTFAQPAPAFLVSRGHALFSPRLSVYLDAQFGERVYVFAQARVDRGFDPTNRGLEVRLDEYALRLTPLRGRPLQLQFGRFATVVGTWTGRHSSWANPFVTAPLVYENLTGIWDSEPNRDLGMLLRWSHVRPGLSARVLGIEKSLRLPVLWGPGYATGMAVAGGVGALRYAFEVKHAPVSSRPETWSSMRGHWRHPTFSGRIGFRPNPMWQVGASASVGSYLRPFASIGARHGRGDYRQLLIGQDISFAWRHFQLWTEIFATRFEIPNVGDAETIAYYAEAKYKFTAQLFGALRWNQQLFGHLSDRNGRVKWGRDATRLDLGLGYRFSAHIQAKLQYNLQQGDTQPHERGHLGAAQFTVRF